MKGEIDMFTKIRQMHHLIIFLILAVILAACSPQETTEPEEIRTLRVMTHDSFAVSEDLINQFEDEHNVKISFIRSGDTGSALNQAILSRENPLADVFYGVDNTFLTRALQEDIFEPYPSPLLENIPDQFKLDPGSSALPVDFGDVCINYDKAYFRENNLPVPESLNALTQPEYEGLLVTENPATSSPGLAFLMATIAQFGEEGYLEFWADLSQNGLVVASDWETAYYSNFSGSTGQGPQPMVVSYGSSPAAEVILPKHPWMKPQQLPSSAPIPAFGKSNLSAFSKAPQTATWRRNLSTLC